MVVELRSTLKRLKESSSETLQHNWLSSEKLKEDISF